MATVTVRTDRGASMVEFAVLAPLLLLLIFGIIEMSRAMFAYTSVWTAAREGARFATTVEADNYVNCVAIEAAAVDRIVVSDVTPANINITYLDASGTTIADCQGGIPPTTSNVTSGSTVEVAITGVTFDAVVPIIEPFFDGFTLDSTQRRVIFVEEQVGG